MRPDRDDPLAPAIRRTLQGSRTDCPEAETIAAYAERSLADAERRGVELHLSTCARCRETLLLMSRAAERPTRQLFSPVPAAFPLYRWPWLAGAAAAGLAVVVWLALPPSAVRTPESDRLAQVTSSADKEKPPVEPEQSAANKAPVASDQASAKAQPAPPGPVAPAAPTPQDRQAFDEKEKKRGLDDRRTDRKLEETGERRARVEAPAAAPQALPPVAPLPPPAAAESVGAVAAPAPPAPARKPDSSDRDTASPQLMARTQQNNEYLTASGPPADARAASAISAVTWRVSPSGIVERSADGGATWTRERGVDAPAARAIHAPSRDVCWIVGDRGLILRFDTGRGWTRLSPPAQVGFMAVEAPDALRATITAADGRRFTTTDGGQTWR